MPKMFKGIKIKRLLIQLSVVLLVVVTDQLSKFFVSHNFSLYESKKIIPGILNFTYILNPGAAFGILSNNRWIFLILSVIAIILIAVYLFGFYKGSIIKSVPLAMICAGGIGNMIDRLFYGSSFGNGMVIDFIDFCAFPKIWSYIFNIADSAVCVGAFWYMIIIIIELITEKKNEK